MKQSHVSREASVRFFFVLLLTLLPSLAWAAPQTTTINGAQISFESCGTGMQTVVLLHDGLANSAVYDDIWPALCKRYKAVRYDRRGFGRTPGATAEYAPADDLAALLKHLGITRGSFIGASAGGGVAVEFALKSPEAVDKLILIGPAIPGFPISKEFIGRLQGFIAALQKQDAAGATAAILANPHMIARGNTAARAKLKAIRDADPGMIGPGAAMFQVHNNETMKRTPEVRAQTLLVIGAADDPQNIAQAEALKVTMPNARLETVANAGHLAYLEQPDIFLRLVTSFLK
jgi:3-oxoadipate enol-lactonase